MRLFSSKVAPAVVGGIVAVTSAANDAGAAVVINEVYAGGGSSSASAAFRTDFVELFNNGATAVDLSGYQLQYASSGRANGVFDIPIGTLPTGSSIAPLGFFLVQTGSAGTGGAADPAANADFEFSNGVSGASLSNTAGSVRITDASGTALDLIGYGNLTNGNFETTAETAPADVTVSLQRTVLGVDSNNNQADFSQLVPTPTAAVPEPASLGLVATGGLLALRRRSRRA